MTTSAAETLSTRELARCLGISERAVQIRSNKESWPHEVVNGRGDRRYPVAALPADVKAKIVQQSSPYIKGMVLPTRDDLDMAQARALLDKFESAPGWSRRKAEARGAIVEAFEAMSRSKKTPLTKLKGDFVRRYNLGNDGLGLDPDVYRLIDRISRPSLDRWRALKRDFGLAGLLDSTRNRRRFCALSSEMKDYIRALKVEKVHRRPRRIYQYLCNKFAGQDLPSEATVRRFIDQWERENAEYVAFLRNPDKWRSTYQAAMGDAGEKAVYFLHMLEFDNTPADVMCADGKRYTITGAIDIYSRKAKVLVVPTARSQAVAGLMRKVILDWGLFDVMIKDNGQDYASRHIDVACSALGIEQPPLPKFSPELKPFIERFFRTLTEGLFEELEGFTGHNVAQAQDLRAARSFAQRMFSKGEVISCGLTAKELQDRIDAWLENVYHRQVHAGIGMSPEQKAGESTRPVRKIMDERVLDILLAPAGTPTVLKNGIRYDNGVYVAVELADWIGRKVQIRRDLSDAGTLYVFSLPPAMRFICVAKDAALEGLTVEEANVARARQKKRVREQVKALKALAKEVGDPMTELIEAKAKAQGRVISFQREEEFVSEQVVEASKAILEPDPGPEHGAPDWEPMRAAPPEKVVPLRPGGDETPIFETKLDRYKYLLAQKDRRRLTERERGFMEGYEGTEEYYQIFVMPYE